MAPTPCPQLQSKGYCTTYGCTHSHPEICPICVKIELLDSTGSHNLSPNHLASVYNKRLATKDTCVPCKVTFNGSAHNFIQHYRSPEHASRSQVLSCDPSPKLSITATYHCRPCGRKIQNGSWISHIRSPRHARRVNSRKTIKSTATHFGDMLSKSVKISLEANAVDAKKKRNARSFHVSVIQIGLQVEFVGVAFQSAGFKGVPCVLPVRISLTINLTLTLSCRFIFANPPNFPIVLSPSEPTQVKVACRVPEAAGIYHTNVVFTFRQVSQGPQKPVVVSITQPVSFTRIEKEIHAITTPHSTSAPSQSATAPPLKPSVRRRKKVFQSVQSGEPLDAIRVPWTIELKPYDIPENVQLAVHYRKRRPAAADPAEEDEDMEQGDADVDDFQMLADLLPETLDCNTHPSFWHALLFAEEIQDVLVAIHCLPMLGPDPHYGDRKDLERFFMYECQLADEGGLFSYAIMLISLTSCS